MNEKNIKRLNSAIQTVSFCESPDSVTATAGIANFAPQVAVIKGKILIVQSYNQIGDATTKGVTLNVVAIRQSMMQHTYLLGNAVYSYGASLTPPDNNLMQLAKIPLGKLETFSKQKCATECDRIRQLAADNALAIVPFGASAADITDTAALVTLYLNGIDDSRGATITRNHAKKQADLTLNDIILNQLDIKLDSMANTLRFTNNEWWLHYHASRGIVDPGTFATVLKIEVLNQANDLPLLNVKCYRDDSITFKKSSTLGFITYKDLDEGAHSFMLKHKLFQDLTIPSVMISHGKKQQVVAKMIPITSGGAGTTTVTRGGDLGATVSTPINVDGFTSTPATMVTGETPTPGANFLVYAAANATDPPGATSITITDVSIYSGTPAAFQAAIGLNATKPIVIIKNNGATNAHWQFTFTEVTVP